MNMLPKTTFASDAFIKTVLGMEVDITINQLGTDVYRILQCDMYHLILETLDGEHLMVAKSAVIAIVCPDTALPDLHTAIAEGVTAINYRASQKRLDGNKKKAYQKAPAREAHPAAPREVQVVIKPKRSFT